MAARSGATTQLGVTDAEPGGEPVEDLIAGSPLRGSWDKLAGLRRRPGWFARRSAEAVGP